MSRHRRTLLPLIAIALGMLMLAYASVPFYRMFCRVTGFGGTTQRVEANTGVILPQTVTVRFNTDIDPNLPWSFAPIEKKVVVHVGENRLIAFRAKNTASFPTRGTATYNVVPHEAGKYFNKIQCFCFEEQHLAPGQEATFPVSFFIDPAIHDDPQLRNLSNITLSYTFFSYESRNKSAVSSAIRSD